MPLQASKHYTQDLEEADIVFVNDYCQMISVTASVHSGGATPGYNPVGEMWKGLVMVSKTDRCAWITLLNSELWQCFPKAVCKAKQCSSR